MEGPRPPQEKEFSKIIEFLDDQLRPEGQWSISSEYPTALSRSNIHNMRIITDEERVLSHAVLKPLIVKTPLMVLKVGAIGSVVTDSNHRNQGLSRKIMEDCLLEAHKQECDLTILWTELYDFYRKMGFELGGFEHSLVLDKSFDQYLEDITAPSYRFLKSAQVAPEAILKLYSHHSVMTARTAEEVKKFLQIPKSQLYTAWDAYGQLQAYAVEGKGADLCGYIHEWGGSTTAILALLNFMQKESKKSLTIILAHHSINLLTALLKVASLHNEGYLGMIKILSPENLFQKIKRSAHSIGLSQLVLERESNGYRMGIGTDHFYFEDEKNLIPLLFGPLPDDLPLQGDTRERMNRLFPLPLWLWGWDSI